MTIINFCLILLSVFLTSIAQLFLKYAMNSIGEVELTLNGFISLFFNAIKNFYMYIGVFAFIASFVVWLVVLSRVNVSIAYPFVGVACVFTVLFGYFLLGEPLTMNKILGIFTICFGIFIITR